MIREKVSMRIIRMLALSLGLLIVLSHFTAPVFAGTEERESLFLKEKIQWKLYDLIDKGYKYFKLPFMEVENGTPDRHSRVVAEKNVAISMRDGVRLRANIYRPRAEGKFPVILTRLPYGKDEYYCWMPAIGKFWAKKGYVFIAQDVRGKFRSEGEFEPLRNEVEDGYDTLEWIVKQPWCDGNVGMEGESYYGYTTWAAATTGHPNLKCISPMNTAMDFYVPTFQNGAFSLQTAGTYPILMHSRTYQNILTLDNMHLPLITMDDAGGIPSPYYDDLLMHPFRDEVTEGLNLSNRADRIEIPILSIAGWYDVFLKTTIDDWAIQREKNADTEAAGKQWILISPSDHESSTDHTNKIGKLDIGGKSAGTRWEMRQEFYDHFLKGIDNGFDKAPPVRIFVIGDNDWRHEDEWPPARIEYKKYYLHSGGSANTLNGDGELGLETAKDEKPDTYTYDPASPVDIAATTDMWFMAAQLKDRTQVEERDDVLVYTSPALERDIEVTGPIMVTLYAASSAVDTDFTAALIDVFPDGYLHLIQEGIQRARYREGDGEPTFLAPDEICEYNIDLWATSHVIKAGHRIRVEISSSNFDRFDRNLNTGKEFGTSSEMVTATQKIYHTSEYPSHITLPTIPR